MHGMKPFTKPAIDVPDQLALLKKRGLIIQNEERAACFLQSVSFFRLTPYMRPFQRSDDADHGFLAGARLIDLTRLYDFDRRLRLLVMDALERVEVAVRTCLSNHMAAAHGAHWYLHRSLFQNAYRHDALLELIRSKQQKALKDHQRECDRIDTASAPAARKLQLKAQRSKESYARHYALTYNAPELMPAWAIMEEITLGDLSHLFKGFSAEWRDDPFWSGPDSHE